MKINMEKGTKEKGGCNKNKSLYGMIWIKVSQRKASNFALWLQNHSLVPIFHTMYKIHKWILRITSHNIEKKGVGESFKVQVIQKNV